MNAIITLKQAVFSAEASPLRVDDVQISWRTYLVSLMSFRPSAMQMAKGAQKLIPITQYLKHVQVKFSNSSYLSSLPGHLVISLFCVNMDKFKYLVHQYWSVCSVLLVNYKYIQVQIIQQPLIGALPTPVKSFVM